MSDDGTWPRNFSPAARDEIRARETPPGMGTPRCFVCGEAIVYDLVIHHRLRADAGAGGDGRISNGIAVHGRLEAGQCHHARIHDDTGPARDAMWLISRHARLPDAYQAPVRCARRGWIVLDNEGGWQPAEAGGD
jgi:hypothetical protein